MASMIFIFVCNLIIPVTMLFFGLKFKQSGPENINGIYGYRTSMSMKNKDTWEFAHQYCGRVWTKLGLVLLIVSTIVSVLAAKSADEVKGKIELALVTI